MYAVFKSGGAQYRAEAGTLLSLEKLPLAVGAQVIFDQVLMVVEANQVHLGQPLLSEYSVQGEVVAQERAKKIVIIKFRRRKHSMKRQGHRQFQTKVKIQAIVQATSAATVQVGGEDGS